jgi:hypothetical protein
MGNSDFEDCEHKRREWEEAKHGEQKLRKELIELGKQVGVAVPMATVLNVKVQYEDNPRTIQATEVKEEYGRLLIFDGDRKIGEFSRDKVEHWSFVKTD